jgi:hypothetical protein
LLLPRVFGLNGLFYAFPLADLCSAAFSAMFLFIEFKRMDAAKRAT